MTVSDEREPHPDDTDNTDHMGVSTVSTDAQADQDQRASNQIDLEVRLKALLAAFSVLLILALVAALSGIAYLTLESRKASEANLELLQGVQQTSNRLIDCTTPEGKCYTEGQERTGAAVLSISEGTLTVIAAALSCQEDGITEQKELIACTTERSRKG